MATDTGRPPTSTGTDEPLARIRNLRISTSGDVPLVNDVSFDVGRGRVLGLVGESGSGKTLTALSLVRLLPSSLRIEGSIEILGQPVLELDKREVQTLRGGTVGFIFQDPLSTLDPTMKVGEQVAEAAWLHRRISHREALADAVELLREVGIPDAQRHASVYPHQLSGGMRQRVGAAIALAGRPALLIADEPTTALDVSVQAQFLRLLHSLRVQRNLTVLLITHDLGVAAQLCDDMAVMYQGRLMETGPAAAILTEPLVPYTQDLIRSVPVMGQTPPAPPGMPSSNVRTSRSGNRCPYAARCRQAMPVCHEETPALVAISTSRQVRCFLFDQEQEA